jgi:hypothetical protein
MSANPINYCRSCSESALSGWKGWPHKDLIPLLPLIGDQGCTSCGAKGELLASAEIHWLNFHGQYNTGLPDYWLLVIAKETVWGHPYHEEVTCRRCKGRAVVSEFGDIRNGRFEYKVNCPACGLLRPQPNNSLQGRRPSRAAP